jgi:uncharacterized membrane protein
MVSLVAVLTVAAAVGSGLMGGVFLAFSVAVIPALRRRPAADAVATMQEINRVIVGPLFLLVFLGTAVVGITLVVLRPTDGLRVLGAALYVLGGFGLTAAVNIPLNNALDRVRPADAEQGWGRFHRRWASANHARGLACAAASVVLAVA